MRDVIRRIKIYDENKQIIFKKIETYQDWQDSFTQTWIQPFQCQTIPHNPASRTQRKEFCNQEQAVESPVTIRLTLYKQII